MNPEQYIDNITKTGQKYSSAIDQRGAKDYRRAVAVHHRALGD